MADVAIQSRKYPGMSWAKIMVGGYYTSWSSKDVS